MKNETKYMVHRITCNTFLGENKMIRAHECCENIIPCGNVFLRIIGHVMTGGHQIRNYVKMCRISFLIHQTQNNFAF